MKLVIFSVLIIGTLGGPAYQSLSVNEDGTYQFSYETGSEGGNHFQTESKGPDGTVIGKYSYSAPAGGMMVVNYRADDTGFVVGEDGEVPKPSASEQKEASEETANPEDSEKEKQKEENSSTTETPPINDDDDDDEKSLKLEEPIKDLPPEGFPPGFFTGQFSALRRLPEPSNEEQETKKKEDDKTDKSTTETTAEAEHEPKGFISASWQPEALPPEAFPPGFFLQHFTGLRRLGEPVTKQESNQTPQGTKSNKPENVAATTTEGKTPVKGFHGGYILPFPSYLPHLWPAPSHHNPVYVYSHQQPNAYTYGYYY